MGGIECRATGSKIATFGFCETVNFCVALAKRKTHKSGEAASFVPPARNPPASKSCDDNCPATANRAESCAFQGTKSVFLRIKH